MSKTGTTRVTVKPGEAPPRGVPGRDIIRAMRGFLALFLVTLAVACGGAAQTQPDPLTTEIDRAAAFLRSEAAGQGAWAAVREESLREMARAQEALRAGRTTLAMFRFATVKANLATAAYLHERPAGQGKEMAAFEAEWKRLGGELAHEIAAPSPAAFDGVRPAAVRAVGEAALPQVRGYYEASLEYGRATAPAQGLYYLGSAQGQREVARFARALSAPTSRREPPLRSIAAELDALESEMLAAYRPPASVGEHLRFIAASSVLKEARELDAAGLRYGALLRYLQAAVRFAPLRQPAPTLEGDVLARRLHEIEGQLAGGDLDHSLGRLFLELAQADVDATAPGTKPAVAAAMATDVLPRYFAALAPPPPSPNRPAPRATVTLVRWPYT